MSNQRVHALLLKGILCLAVILPAVRAEEDKKPEEKKPEAKPAVVATADPCGPRTTTVMVEECVPEQYTTTRTAYRMEQVKENYTAYKTETVCEPRTRMVTTYKLVPEVKTCTRTVCDMVPTVEERCVMEKHWVCKPVTTIKRKCVDQGHYECQLVPCSPSLRDRVKKFCCKSDCCNDCCVPMKTKKVWVPCKVWIEEPCTKMVRTCEYRPVMQKVTVCKPHYRQENYTVTVNRCVPETHPETYNVTVCKQVPYQATRLVCKCVPFQETVTCCKMVKRLVAKEVVLNDCCATTCCTPCCRTIHTRKCCK